MNNYEKKISELEQRIKSMLEKEKKEREIMKMSCLSSHVESVSDESIEENRNIKMKKSAFSSSSLLSQVSQSNDKEIEIEIVQPQKENKLLFDKI